MYTTTAFTVALLTLVEQAFAQTADQNDKYPRWAKEMDLNGYTWEAIEVTTDDDYILTTFHITGTKEGGLFKPTKPPVLIQHGLMQDASSWMEDYHTNPPFYYTAGKPMPLQLADLGYDVFMGNNRGTEYSLGHKSLSTEEQAYWEFSWAQMGLYDDPAIITMIKN